MKKPTLAIGNSNLSYGNGLYARVPFTDLTYPGPHFNESIAQCNVPDEWLQANVSLVSGL